MVFIRSFVLGGYCDRCHLGNTYSTEISAALAECSAATTADWGGSSGSGSFPFSLTPKGGTGRSMISRVSGFGRGRGSVKLGSRTTRTRTAACFSNPLPVSAAVPSCPRGRKKGPRYLSHPNLYRPTPRRGICDPYQQIPLPDLPYFPILFFKLTKYQQFDLVTDQRLKSLSSRIFDSLTRFSCFFR